MRCMRLMMLIKTGTDGCRSCGVSVVSKEKIWVRENLEGSGDLCTLK